MALMNQRQLKFNRVGLRLVLVLAAAALALPAVASAKPDGKEQGGPKVTVMTRNLFLGADLGPVIGAGSIPEAIDGAGEIWNEFQSTNFPERAVPLAREIERAKPDLVGLQEAALWRTADSFGRRRATAQPAAGRDASDDCRPGLPSDSAQSPQARTKVVYCRT